VLDNFDELFPQYKDQGYEIAGFVWWQGHKDQNPVHASRYEQNLINLISAWRKEFNAPNAKFAIATIAFGGWDLSGPGKAIAEAQLAVSDYEKYPEHKGNIKTIEARDFWRDPGESPKNQGYHYNHNGETYFLVGDALGRAMVEMQGGKAEKRRLPERKPQLTQWPANPTLDDHVRMLYSDAFISPWAKSDAEPTPEDLKAMAPALAPMILDDMIPAYVASTPGVPAYRRHGALLLPIVTGQTPKGKSADSLRSQFDKVIEYYNAAGVHDYDWKKFGPDMQNAQWHYLTFDPPEKVEAGKPRYREVTYPPGSENWFAADFDPAKAGWKIGGSPFGQKNGELKPLRTRSHPQCGSHIPPKTLWDKEVLLMRQTFEVPKFEPDHRYRLVVGGGSYAWSGEAFEVYVNGKLFAIAKNGNYKKGSTRGRYIFDDFKPEFESGKVTIAVKAFLRSSGYRNKPAPPSGHISVWLESAKMPKSVLDLAKTERK
jgi:hypothetical protein